MGKTIRLTPKNKPTYKYNLNHQLGLLPRDTKIEKVLDHLKDSGVTRNEFYSDRSIPFGSTKSIPYDRMVIYSQVFGCMIDDLSNQTPSAKPLRPSSTVSVKSKLK